MNEDIEIYLKSEQRVLYDLSIHHCSTHQDIILEVLLSRERQRGSNLLCTSYSLEPVICHTLRIRSK